MQGWEHLVGEAGGNIGTSEMAVRALIIFVYGVTLTRLGGWRVFGKLAPPDIIVAVIVGSNLSRALTGHARLVPTLVATTLLFVAYWAVAWAASHWPLADRIAKGRAVSLIEDGKIDQAAMRRWAVSLGDLEEALRECGFAAPGKARRAYLERNGKITVLGGRERERVDS